MPTPKVLVIGCVDNRLPALSHAIYEAQYGTGNYFQINDVGAFLGLREGSSRFPTSVDRIEEIFQLCEVRGGLEIHMYGHEDCRGYRGLCSCTTPAEWLDFMSEEINRIGSNLRKVPLFRDMETRFEGHFIYLDGTHSKINIPAPPTFKILPPPDGISKSGSAA